MADRRDYYFRQTVTEAELDAGFNGLEQADFNMVVDLDLTGIVDGLGVSQKAGTPDISVDVASGVAYTRQGERVRIPSTQNKSVATDDAAASTAVAVGGNEKWVSLFIDFDRALSDPRLDGNSVTVYFVRAESFKFSVIQGAEAAIGTATRPALDSNKILLCDIRRTFGQTQILNADISTTRREDSISITAGSPVDIIAGSPAEAISDLVTELNAHINGSAHFHDADHVVFGAAGSWHDGSGLAATSAEDAINEIVSDLAAASGNGGADRIYSGAISDTPSALAAGSIWDVLTELLGHVNDRLRLAGGDLMTGSVDFTANATTNPSAGADPGKNKLHALNAPKVFAKIAIDGAGGATLSEGYGVSSVSINGSNDLVITFSNAFANANYAWLTGSLFSGGNVVCFVEQSATTTTLTLRARNANDGSQVNLNTTAVNMTVGIFGRQT